MGVPSVEPRKPRWRRLAERGESGVPAPYWFDLRGELPEELSNPAGAGWTMRESPEQLHRRIRRGEDGALELKEVVFAGSRVVGPRRNELADELAAFANGAGGTVVLGVRDSPREVVGLAPERQAVLERYVTELVRDSIEPALYPEIDWYELFDDAELRLTIFAAGSEEAGR